MNNILQFRGHVEILTDSNEDLRLTRTLKRCNKDDALTPCEIFSTFNEKNVCQNLNNMYFYGKNFFSKIRPVFQCPLKKGTYDLSKAFIDAEDMLKLPVEGREWRQQIKIFLTRTDQLLYCAEWSLKILAQSSRRSSNGQRN